MARVTSKLQVTIPKAIAQRYRIQPGEEVEFLPAGEAIRLVPQADRHRQPDRGRRLELFDRATERQRARQAARSTESHPTERGWRRQDLYDGGVAD